MIIGDNQKFVISNLAIFFLPARAIFQSDKAMCLNYSNIAPLPINVTIALTEQSNFQMNTMINVRAAPHEMPNSAVGPDGAPLITNEWRTH